MKPKIAISVGDINGVGIEIALKAHKEISKICQPIYFINSKLLNQAAKILNINIPKNFDIYECDEDFEIKPGKVSKKSGKFSFISFENALHFTAKGKASALVTLPINKESWKKAKIPYKGHTDALSDYFKTSAIMMLGCEELYVALFSDHMPLRDVSKKIKFNKVKNFLLDFYASTKFSKVGVLGFNPHAGDNGVLGTEEEEIIIPAIKKANEMGITCFGPYPADGFFGAGSFKSFDAVLAMYHDQGLTPFKCIAMESGVNYTANLPIIRTSPAHGTAYDKVGIGSASEESFRNALYLACDIYKCRKNYAELIKNRLKKQDVEISGQVE
jgi:4-hydroxythreonine-4-phosphate dehydrogenase